MSRNFQRKIEDFTCEHCGFFVKGNGYTNHCPKCLFSKHVDIHPGDRKEACGGLMEPVDFEFKKNQYVIHYRCQNCGAEKHNHASNNDNINILVKLSQTIVKKAMF